MAALLRGAGTGRSAGLRVGVICCLWVVFLGAALFVGAGCGTSPGGDTGEQLGYLATSGDHGRLMLTSTAGGEGDSLLEWQGSGERFFFSNDGRFFTITLWNQPPGAKPKHRFFIAASDGSKAFHLVGNIDLLTFSPDSTRVAYVTLTETGPNDVMVMDVGTGQARTVASGEGLLTPVWVDNQTLVYTELKGSSGVSRAEGGIIHRVNLETGADTALTPPERHFSMYSAPVSWPRPKVALIERGSLNHIWSLDVASGQLRQITNNNLDHFRAGYLADGDTILFQEQKSLYDTMSSELCTLKDDGSDFRMLTANFYFDGLVSFSTATGKIACQQAKDTGETSIWAINEDGSDPAQLYESDSVWIGDPNFVPVAGWQERNPLKLGAGELSVGQPYAVTVSNSADHPVKAVLRAFPARNLSLSAEGSHAGEARLLWPEGSEPPQGLEKADPQVEWSLDLGAGETATVDISTDVRPTPPPAGETALLLTLSVPGSPPRMFWLPPGSMRRGNV